MAQKPIEQARAEVERARASLVEAWRTWAALQGAHLRESLLSEGKLTATRQPEVTVEVGDGVRELRSALSALADRHGRALEEWGESLEDVPDDSAMDVWANAVNRARVEFGELFFSRGYRATGAVTSRDWAGAEGWEFYVPSAGTGRGRHLPFAGGANKGLGEAERNFSEAARALRALEATAAKQAAEDLWED